METKITMMYKKCVIPNSSKVTYNKRKMKQLNIELPIISKLLLDISLHLLT